MKFQRDTGFDTRLDEVSGLVWYPYIGRHFGANGTRIMVYAHNIPIKPDQYEEKVKEWADKATWAECIEEYTYCQANYTRAFRSFIKGAVGLDSGYGSDSEPSVVARVDAFIETIAYQNFVQGLVKSDTQLALAPAEQIELSKKVNSAILNILGITHCICWGKPTYQYVCAIEGFKVVFENNLGRGFSSSAIDVGEGKTMQCLRIHHPSMPGFNSVSEFTQSTISDFLRKKAS